MTFGVSLWEIGKVRRYIVAFLWDWLDVRLVWMSDLVELLDCFQSEWISIGRNVCVNGKLVKTIKLLSSLIYVSLVYSCKVINLITFFCQPRFYQRLIRRIIC